MNSSHQPALTAGVHHVGLTVTNVEEAKTFFVETLGFSFVGGRAEYPAAFVSDGETMITLWQAADRARPFDRRQNVGLHHLALTVRSNDKLEALHERLRDTNGVQIELAPESLGDGPARHMMCSIPGGVRVEFIVPATPAASGSA